jgi:hypothetical protein
MLTKIENGRQTWIPLMVGVKENGEMDLENTTDSTGIGMNKTYKVSWKMNHSGFQRELIKVKGSELIKRSSIILNTYFSEKKPNGEYPDWFDVKEVTQTYLNLYGHGLTEPKTYRTLKELNHPHNFNLVKRVLKKRKGVEWDFVLSMISTYYMFKRVQETERIYDVGGDDRGDRVVSNHLVVTDYQSPPSWIYESKDENSEIYWKNQPIVKRLGMSFEDYIEGLQIGFLMWDWV